MTHIAIRRPDDFHLHLREGALLKIMLDHLGPIARATVMPNTKKGILTGKNVECYQAEILKNLPPWSGFTPLMTIKITTQTTPEIILEAKEAGAVGAKYYPPQLTTNSNDGIPADKFCDRDDLFKALEEAGMLLLLHGEHDQSEFCLDREQQFLFVLDCIACKFPNLRIVMEHITTARAVAAVKSLKKNVAATITPHHLKITLNDVIGGKLHPHNFCMPVAKRPEDRKALIEAATSGNPKFFAGTDDAAHLKGNKECAEGCAGVFTGEWGILHYADVFDQVGAMPRLADFVSRFGAEFYGLPLNSGVIGLVNKPVAIPTEDDGLVPFEAGMFLPWSYE